MSGEKKAVIHIDPAMEQGNYANAATIMHSPTEFILDFLMLLPGERRKVVSRIITSPSHAKQFAAALLENVAKYESSYGEITMPGKEPEFTGTVN
ncbi:MAG: DUF3467 domain-containing protein [Pseudomonadota bacterium]|jgi:hypothetical protein